MRMFTSLLRLCWLMAAVLWLAAVPAHAAAPLLEKLDLFTAGEGGYALYRIPGMVVTTKGTVLAYCEARRTGKSDWDSIDILLRRSTDGGKTWDAPRKLSNIPGPKPKNPVVQGTKLAAPEDVTYNNPVAIVDRDGTIHFLFCLEYMRCFYLRSTDDGVTWSEPVEITSTFEKFRAEYDWKVIATGPAHGIQMRNGRLMVPIWMSLGTEGGAHRPSCVATIFSDDHGKTWQRSEIVISDPDLKNPSETVAVELTDGRVILNIRCESTEHHRAFTYSRDGSTGWAPIKFDPALLEPICMASIVRVSDRKTTPKTRIAFANPNNLARADGKDKPGGSRDRVNLSVKMTYDECRTWPVNKVLEPGFSAYSDLAALPDGTILCLYERGHEADAEKKKPTSYAYLTLARFNVEWLSDGKDVYILSRPK